MSVAAIDKASGDGAGRPVVYCLLPGDLAAKLHEPLRRHFDGDPAVEVVVEQRELERRRSAERRRARGGAPGGRERRTILAPAGRRAGERRAVLVQSSPLSLPRRARRYAERIVFLERFEPAGEQLEDVDTDRLVARIQGGASDQFELLYLRYFPRVYGYLRVALNDPHEAENAAQQVFTEVFRGLPGYEDRGRPFRAWLFAIVRNRAIDSLRRSGRLEVTDPAEIDRRRDSSDPDQSVDVLDWISDTDLQFLVARLPEPQQQVLMLRFMIGLSSAEIGAILGRTDKSVRMLQHRALTFLRERLTALGRAPRKQHRSRSHRVLRRSPVAYGRRFGLLGPGPLR